MTPDERALLVVGLVAGLLLGLILGLILGASMPPPDDWRHP
jgi:hypothetical protein